MAQGQGCMFLLGDSLLPSPLCSCMSVSPAVTQDFQAPGFLETRIQPLLRPSPPCPSPGKGAPAGPNCPQPAPVVSRVAPGPARLLEVQTGCDRAVGKVSCLLGSSCGPSLVRLLLLWGHLLFLSPLAFLSPSQ